MRKLVLLTIAFLLTASTASACVANGTGYGPCYDSPYGVTNIPPAAPQPVYPQPNYGGSGIYNHNFMNSDGFHHCTTSVFGSTATTSCI